MGSPAGLQPPCGCSLQGRGSPDKSRCAWMIASSNALRSSCSFFEGGTLATNRSAAVVKVCSVSAMSPCLEAGDNEASRNSARLLLGPTYICGAIGLSFSNSGRRNIAIASPKHQTTRNNQHTVLDSRRQLHRGVSTGGNGCGAVRQNVGCGRCVRQRDWREGFRISSLVSFPSPNCQCAMARPDQDFASAQEKTPGTFSVPCSRKDSRYIFCPLMSATQSACAALPPAPT